MAECKTCKIQESATGMTPWKSNKNHLLNGNKMVIALFPQDKTSIQGYVNSGDIHQLLTPKSQPLRFPSPPRSEIQVHGSLQAHVCREQRVYGDQDDEAKIEIHQRLSRPPATSTTKLTKQTTLTKSAIGQLCHLRVFQNVCSYKSLSHTWSYFVFCRQLQGPLSAEGSPTLFLKSFAP